jgi:hypothetical protein
MKGSDRFNSAQVRAVCCCCGRTVEVRNLSLGGAFVASEELPRCDESVSLEVSLPGQASFRLLGIVSWVNSPTNKRAPELPAGYGLRFLNIDMVHKLQLIAFLKQREEERVR